MIYDVAIIGGGPSGATLARLIGGRYKVLLVDRRNLDESSEFRRAKCCGGLLAPDAQKVLAQFGLGLPGEVMVGPQMFSVRSVDFDNGIQRYYQRHYINIDREGFDRWMLFLVPGSVEIRTSCVFRGFREKGELMEVDLSGPGGAEKIYARLLVGADGATSKVRRMIAAPGRQPDKYVSIQEWYRTPKQLPHFVSVFDSGISDFYSWVIQKGDLAVVGAAISDYGHANEKFRLLVDKLRAAGYEFGECVRREGTWIMRPRSAKQISLYRGNAALIGEAAGFISPSSAEGISYA